MKTMILILTIFISSFTLKNAMAAGASKYDQLKRMYELGKAPITEEMDEGFYSGRCYNGLKEEPNLPDLPLQLSPDLPIAAMFAIRQKPYPDDGEFFKRDTRKRFFAIFRSERTLLADQANYFDQASVEYRQSQQANAKQDLELEDKQLDYFDEFFSVSVRTYENYYIASLKVNNLMAEEFCYFPKTPVK